MNPQSQPIAVSAAQNESQVMEVLEKYLRDLEHGVPPDPEKLLALYPDLAGELRGCLASLAFLHGAAEVMGERQLRPPRTETPTSEEDRRLGDFRLLRDIGRGGMGIVYEAEQISLKRRVALKVLPFAAVLDPKQLQRFKNEAQVAAGLNHPRIAAVYYVGSDRGVHFYAMQYVEGQSLSELIARTGPCPPARDRASGR